MGYWLIAGYMTKQRHSDCDKYFMFIPLETTLFLVLIVYRQKKFVSNIITKYRRHSKECMWRQQGHFYIVFNVYDSKVTRGKGEAHVALC